VVLHPAQAMHGDLGILVSGDVLLALSYSGTSEEILNLIPLVRRLGVAIVALTGATDSPLARNSDAVINVAVDREACPFNMAPTASTTATLAVGDALAMVLLEARGFGREDYAKLHPGGAIGRALLTRVADIMRTGDRVARTGLGATVKDAVVAMTQARSGSAAIVDAEGRLLGIFTDGDLRRAVSLSADVLSRPVAEFMTRSPLSVRPDELAVDVLHVFERHDIDDIPVLDDHNRVVGTVDIVDLPKMKIM
jgi:arabinose-5-phosphate isomerase